MKKDKDYINYVINCLSTLNAIPFGEYDKEGNLVRKYWMNGEELPSYYKSFIAKAIESMKNKRIIRARVMNYPIALWIYLSDNNKYYVWGPVQYDDISQNDFKAYEVFNKNECFNYQVFKTSYENVLAHISLFSLLLDNRRFSEKDMTDYKLHLESVSRITEQNIEHLFGTADGSLSNHSYSDEQYPLELLAAGDEEGAQRYIHLRRISYPTVIESDKKKNEEYMAVASISIMTRAAIEAGVPASGSFRLSDVFLNRIAKCKNHEDITREREEAFLMFTSLVKKHKSIINHNPYVIDCKNDIARRIYQSISLKDIAKNLNLRSTYLARLFKEEEGISVGKYIQQEKIKLAMEMLKYSDRTILEIADYLSFSSQSYFGKVFKLEAGVSPEQYRKNNRAVEY